VEEETQTDGFHHPAHGPDSDLFGWPPFGEDLGNELRGGYGQLGKGQAAEEGNGATYARYRGGEEDESSDAGSTLIRHMTTGVEHCGDAVRLYGAAGEGRTPRNRGAARLTRMHELLF
jgi:hypothetical protein